jgi:hypothetical protein
MIMTYRERISFALVLGSAFLLGSCGRMANLAAALINAQGQAQDAASDADHLVQVARTYATGHKSHAQPAALGTTENQTELGSSRADGTDQEAEYKNDIMMDLVRKNYDALDKAARENRVPSARFAGGTWKAWGFYEGLNEPPTGDSATNDDWEAQIDALKAWVAARPESAAARIALADAYGKWAWKARGSGYANTVSGEGWQLYSERYAIAASILVDAAKLREKSPYWYSVMQGVALAQGWNKSQAKALLDAAIAFEPSYYHAYREYVNFVLPKWYGEEGDGQTFAEEVSTQIGGEQGDFVYFELATTIACGCDTAQDRTELQSLSWPKIKSGYAAMKHLYGDSSLKTNRFAYLAVVENDKPTAAATLAVIGDAWNPKVWPSHVYFLQARAWADGQPGQ